jgi:hypothetical protein
MNVNQISVFLENRTGGLSEITRLLAESGINLRAISIAETADYGVLRLIVDDAEKATFILHQQGFILSMTPVSVVCVPDEIGGLAPVLEALAKGNMDVEYMYSLFTYKEGNAYMVMRVSDDPKFLSTLGDRKIKLMTQEELGLK